MKESIAIYREKVDKRLIFRQRIFFVIISVLTVINILNVVHEKISVMLAVSGFLLSVIIGLILSRMFKIFWHEEKGKVVSKLDTLGIILLAIYITLEIGRTWFLEHWLSGAALSASGLIILSGLILGRFLGTFIKIKSILSESAEQSDGL